MAKLVANMNVEIADEVLGKMAEAFGGGAGKGVSEVVMEIRDVGGKLIIKATPAEDNVVVGGSGGGE
ncbi:hypothetical protein [Thermococcus sp.]|uniref:hypothetical protein n=1 Tax=Thermococcus sp. TaxID=35749 RepID=UPI002624C7BF|nr:hypothetical protein [Thermococcus sp.]